MQASCPPLTRFILHQMLYSPERSSLADAAPKGSVLTGNILPAGTKSGRCHTLHGAKEKNGSSMGRGYKSIIKLSIVLRHALLLVLLCCAAALGSATAHAQSASTWNKRGQDAEARQNYDAAYEDYHQAMLKNPSDLRYKARYEHTRFLASVGHVDRGRVLRQSGDINGAIAEFKHALQIDPSNQTAQQEIDQLQQVLQNPQANAAPERSEQLSRQNETLDTIGSIAGPVELKPV